MAGIEDQIKEEIAANKILIYGKGTKAAPNVDSPSKPYSFSINMVTLLKLLIVSKI